MDLLIVLLQFFGCLSALVLIHEFGHFVTAKMFGVRVDKFFIFFNPGFSLFKFKPKNSETTYGIGWLPLGGYVKLAGMIDESMDTDFIEKEPQPWEFRSKPAWQRLIIMVAGVVMNFLLAIAIYIGSLYHWGEDYIALKDVTTGMEFSWTGHEAGFVDGDIILKADGAEVLSLNQDGFRQIVESKQVTVLREGKEVSIDMPSNFMQKMLTEGKGFATYRLPFIVEQAMDNSPAKACGLTKGDKIIEVNGTAVMFTQASKIFKANPNKEVTLTVLRGNDTLSIKVTPTMEGRIGAAVQSPANIFKITHKSYGLIESVPAGIKCGVAKLTGYANDMKYVFTPEGMQSMGGFGTLASLFPNTFNWQYFLQITAFLSVILAFMNILPIPALDGGHAMFVIYEMITRKKPSPQFLMKAQMIGVILLLFLMLFANGNDLFRLFR